MLYFWDQADAAQLALAGSGEYENQTSYSVVQETYVTAATHQGQTRYGRKNLGGLSGRDPGVLPGCVQPD